VRDLLSLCPAISCTCAAPSVTPVQGTFDAFRRIPREEGFRGFYKGVGPSVQRAAIINGCGIASYDHTKQVRREAAADCSHAAAAAPAASMFAAHQQRLGLSCATVPLSLPSGASPRPVLPLQVLIRLLGTDEGASAKVLGSLVSGLVSALVSTPFDVVKTRIMNQPHGVAPLYTGELHGVLWCTHVAVCSEAVWRRSSPSAMTFMSLDSRLRDTRRMHACLVWSPLPFCACGGFLHCTRPLP